MSILEQMNLYQALNAFDAWPKNRTPLTAEFIYNALTIGD